ncbi:MAG: glycosyltransferase family 39 protein, partial [Nitrospinota bacterium]|nr:glycosyltransferase family 39 protein [Nitrospinota bacterium]
MTIDTPANEHVPARHTFFAPVATVLIILVSLVLRVEYYRDLSATPLAQYHLAENSDMNFFHQWGMNIASGDILSSKAPFPITLLYKDVARKFLAGNPSVAARLAQTSGGKSAEEAVWGVWFGKGFYQEPLYPYLVAATYYLFGADPRHVFIWQMLLGVMTNLLLFTLARKYFGDLAACFTALIAVFYGPALFNDLTLLRTTLNVFLAVSLIWIVSMVMEKRGRLAWFALGLAVGVAMLSKTIFVLYFISIIPLLYYRHGVRRAVVLGAMALAGITLALSPAVVRNMEVGAPPMALATGGALAFVSSNSMGYNPWRGLAPSMRHVPRIMGETSGKLVPAMVATLRTHDGPL